MQDDSNFLKLVEKFKDHSELQAYSEAQFNTIINLNKQINKLKEEKEHLERLVGVSTQSISPVNNQSSNLLAISIPYEEEIALKQLEGLRDISLRGQLTLEEARKTEIYSKILAGLRQKPKDVDGEFKNLSNEELLKLTELPNNGT